MDDKVVIKGKKFNRDYVIEIGETGLKRSAAVFSRVGMPLAIIGLFLLITGIILVAADTGTYDALIGVYGIVIGGIHLVAGCVLILIYNARVHRPAFEYGKRMLEKQLPDLPKRPSIENLDELLKYKELLDKGIISNEEFEARKKELLG